MGVPFFFGVENVQQFSKNHGLSIEEAARTLRYQFLFHQANTHGAQAVVVGHTANDQVETVLMHLLRGSGLAGLKGMTFRSLPNSWSQQIPLIRPLLGTWRQEILEYLETQGLQPVLDASNQDTRLYRNRIRHELLPILNGFNPGIQQRLWQMAQLLSEDYVVLEEATDAAWQSCVSRQGFGYIGLDSDELRTQPVGLQRQLLRRAIRDLRPSLRDVDFATIERCRIFINNTNRKGQIDLVAGLRLLWEGRTCWLTAYETEIPNNDSSGWPGVIETNNNFLTVPGVVNLTNNWQISASQIDLQKAIIRGKQNTDPYQAWIDAGCLTEPLILRERQPGDHFQPLGMGGRSTKLSDFMINVKLPIRARAHWPLVVSGETIIWIPGMRLAHPCRLTQSTRQAIHLCLEKFTRK